VEDTIPLLILGGFLLLMIIRALVRGAASADAESITREEEPFFYWLIITMAIAGEFILLWAAFTGG
jgi:hypothetical protein